MKMTLALTEDDGRRKARGQVAALRSPSPGLSPPPIVLVNNNTHFFDYVAAVGDTIGATIVGLPDCRHLPRVATDLQPRSVIVDMHRPEIESPEILPGLAAAGSVIRLVIIAPGDTPSRLAAADRMARATSAWAVEFWEKPLHAAFLKARLTVLATGGPK